METCTRCPLARSPQGGEWHNKKKEREREREKEDEGEREMRREGYSLKVGQDPH